MAGPVRSDRSPAVACPRPCDAAVAFAGRRRSGHAASNSVEMPPSTRVEGSGTVVKVMFNVGGVKAPACSMLAIDVLTGCR